MSYETTQSCEMAYETLQSLFSIWICCFEDVFHLSQINFNSSLGYHKPLELPYTDIEVTLS